VLLLDPVNELVCDIVDGSQMGREARRCVEGSQESRHLIR
jgi:hypothetical protein